MRFQLLNQGQEPLVLTEKCFGAIGTYATRVLLLCHDAPIVAVKHKLLMWDDDRVVIPYDFHNDDFLSVGGRLYSGWEMLECPATTSP